MSYERIDKNGTIKLTDQEWRELLDLAHAADLFLGRGERDEDFFKLRHNHVTLWRGPYAQLLPELKAGAPNARRRIGLVR